MLYLWGCALLVFLILEAITAGLSSIWFAAGALCGLIVTLLHGPFWLQILVFLAVSALTLWLTRPLVKKYVNSKITATNADRAIGMEGLVLEEIDNRKTTGIVKVDGKTWSARSADHTIIAKDALVYVRQIDGVKLIVSPLQIESQAVR